MITAQPPYDLDQLHTTFVGLSPLERVEQLYAYFPADQVLVTSSFGTSAALLLALIAEVRPNQPIYFIDTTYHFPETHAYRRQLVQQFNLQVVDLFPEAEANALTRAEQWWINRQDDCCGVNKVAPLDALKGQYQVWVSGVMGFQTPFRQSMRIFEPQDQLLKFHPLIDLTEGEFQFYQTRYQLPAHPLEAQGYGSVGCTHCTKPGAGRSGRWADSEKTECGLHPGYFEQKKR